MFERFRFWKIEGAGTPEKSRISRGFPAGDQNIPWGTSFSEACEKLKGLPQFSPYGGWPNARFRCSEIYGLRATEFEIRSPFQDRPVMQVSYQLAPVPGTAWGKLHSPYVQRLKAVLGSPFIANASYKDSEVTRVVSGTVVYSAKWLFGNVRVSLSVYGGIRREGSGDCAAGLFFDWINEKKAAAAFTEQNRRLEKALWHGGLSLERLEKFTLASEQRKFRVVHYDVGDPDVNRDEELRLAQAALYCNDLLRTPETVAQTLGANEVAISFQEAVNFFFIGNKWDATFFAMNDWDEMWFEDVLPARGPGFYALRIKDLTITDSRTSSALPELVSYIEMKTGWTVSKRTYYDD